MSKSLAALIAVTSWSIAAHAADKPAASTGTMQTKSGRLVPEQFSTLFKIKDDDNPEEGVPTPKDRTRNPLEFGYYLQDLLTRAEVEVKRNDYPRVIKYYRALAMAIPEEAAAWSLLCETYEKTGDRERATRACKYAIERNGVQFKDYRRYVDLLTDKPGELDADDRTELNAVLAHLDSDKTPEADMTVPIAHLRCTAAVKMKDQRALEACTAVLAKAAPDDKKTIVFQWSLAVMSGDREQAGLLFDKAQKAGLGPENLDRMSKVAIESHWWTAPGKGIAVLGAVVLLAALALFGYRRRWAIGRWLAP